jgi:anti-sigma B factor antagonist
MMRKPTKVISRLENDIRVVKITGRLDPGDGHDPLNDYIKKFMEAGETNYLLDMRAVTYISSMGVGSLMKFYRAVLEMEGVVKLLSPSQSVRNILAISKLDSVFQIFADEQEALGSFAEKPEPLIVEKKTAARKKKPS